MVLALAGCAREGDVPPVTNLSESNPDGKNGAVLAEEYVLPKVSLTATDGSPYSLTEDTTRPLTLVFFGYSHCPDLCQVVMSDITSAIARLDASDQEKVGMLFITSDPARDDAAALRKYLDRFDPTFEGLTGSLSRITKVGNALGVEIERGTKLPSGGYDVAHGTQIVAIDERDRAPVVWTEGTPAGDLSEDISELLAENG
ncbi:MAG: SCO family protein [Actinomycetota bacterium]|nr:SCO family protein [Actinomycetota bacterium]